MAKTKDDTMTPIITALMNGESAIPGMRVQSLERQAPQMIDVTTFNSGPKFIKGLPGKILLEIECSTEEAFAQLAARLTGQKVEEVKAEIPLLEPGERKVML